jgi:hypothetical protein
MTAVLSGSRGWGVGSRRWRRDVPLDAIGHDDRPCYRAEGVAGLPIDRWPIFAFYRAYAAGEREAALERFERWTRAQFDQYALVPKHLGGMSGGSLSRLIEQRHRAQGLPFDGDPRHADPEVVASAVRERVRERLGLLDTIAKDGYRPELAGDVLGIRRREMVLLREGHHRAAILRVLGADCIPAVTVFPHRVVYAMVRRWSEGASCPS